MGFLDHPAVQGGVAPLVVALVVALALARTPFAWLAIVCGFATTIALTTGIAAVLSASIVFLLTGIALAAASGAVLVVQVILRRNIAAGFTGALTIAVLASLFAAGSLMLAQLPWYALPLLVLVPVAAML